MTIARILPASVAAVGPTHAAPRAAGDGPALFRALFDGTTSPTGLTLYNGDGTGTVAISGGELGLTINAGGTGDSLWFDGDEGVLVYTLVTGDFDAVASVRVRNSANDGLPTVGDGNYRVAGLAAHDPDRTGGVLNYVHVGLGCIATAGIEVEYKTTIDSLSDYNNTAPTGASTGAGQLRIRRIGTVFSLFYRVNAAAAWTLVQAYDRSDDDVMPATLQLGFICYSNQAVHDIRLFSDSLVVSRP